MMKKIVPSEQHKQFRKYLEGAIAMGAKDLPAEEILAITSHFVGQLIALQDQRKYSSAMVMEIVHENIVQGNSESVNSLLLAKPHGNS